MNLEYSRVSHWKTSSDLVQKLHVDIEEMHQAAPEQSVQPPIIVCVRALGEYMRRCMRESDKGCGRGRSGPALQSG